MRLLVTIAHTDWICAYDWLVLGGVDESVLVVHRTTTDWVDKVETCGVGEGEILLAIASVLLSGEPEGHELVEDRG